MGNYPAARVLAPSNFPTRRSIAPIFRFFFWQASAIFFNSSSIFFQTGHASPVPSRSAARSGTE